MVKGAFLTGEVGTGGKKVWGGEKLPEHGWRHGTVWPVTMSHLGRCASRYAVCVGTSAERKFV